MLYAFGAALLLWEYSNGHDHTISVILLVIWAVLYIRNYRWSSVCKNILWFDLLRAIAFFFLFERPEQDGPKKGKVQGAVERPGSYGTSTG